MARRKSPQKPKEVDIHRHKNKRRNVPTAESQAMMAEIDEEARETLKSDISRPFDRPESGRIAVKVINHLGDEVMKVFRV